MSNPILTLLIVILGRYLLLLLIIEVLED